jgi:hypothetical protein
MVLASRVVGIGHGLLQNLTGKSECERAVGDVSVFRSYLHCSVSRDVLPCSQVGRRSRIFRKDISPPSSGSKNKADEKQEVSRGKHGSDKCEPRM